jgi:hypothetical protein
MGVTYHKYVRRDEAVPAQPKDSKATARQKAERAKWDTEFRKARAEHERLKRTEREANLARMQGDLIARVEANRQANHFLTVFRQRMLLLPAAISRKHDIPESCRHQIRMSLDTAIREALNELGQLSIAITQSDYDRLRAEQEGA